MEEVKAGQYNLDELKAQKKEADKLIEKVYESDYFPSPLMPRECFMDRKKREVYKLFSKRMDLAFPGVIEFSLLETGNLRIDQLLERFLDSENSSKNTSLTGEQIKEDVFKSNLFDLTEDDFQSMVIISDEIYQKGDYDKAIKLYQALTVLFPLHIEGWIKWGNVLYQHFVVQDAIQVFEECLLYFSHPMPRFCLGMCKIQLDDFKGARADLETALGLCDELNEVDLKEDVLSIYNDLEDL